MYESFGAAVDDPSVELRLFLPNATQFVRGGDARIRSVRAAGTFQETPWDAASALELTPQERAEGTVWTHRIDALADGFYEYKYVVTFDDGTVRWVGDPCSKYGCADHENAGFVVGGSDTAVEPIAHRLPLRDLVLYELMVDDFTAEYRGTRAPLDAVRDRLDHLQHLGVNAIAFMPWTSWPGSAFSWGYDPFAFFAVEHRLYHDPAHPLDKLFQLKRLINEIHARDMHVIMDGVFNHVSAGTSESRGFPYYWLYRDPADSPFIGRFGDAAFFQDFDFRNECTAQFILDVCRYWIDEYQVDGIRFDYVKGFFDEGATMHGIERLVHDLGAHAAASEKRNVSFILELLTDERYEAVDRTNKIGASGCWFDPLMFESWEAGRTGRTRPSLVRALHTGRDFEAKRRPVTYIENHDHSTVVEKTGGRELWWRTQPAAIALFTVSGAPMIHNGQEFGEQYWMPEDGPGRVEPRPLRWDRADNVAGLALGDLYRRLIEIRKAHPSLRTTNFYPDGPPDEGYGVDPERGLVVFHRWGEGNGGKLERFIVVLNFSPFPHRVDVPFTLEGRWDDLLNGHSVEVEDFRLRHHLVPSHWGEIWFRED